MFLVGEIFDFALILTVGEVSDLAYFFVSACPYKKLTLRIVYAIIISAILSATFSYLTL